MDTTKIDTADLDQHRFKKILWTMTAVAGILGMMVFLNLPKAHDSEIRTAHFTELTKEQLKEIPDQLSRGDTYIFEFRAGDKIPLTQDLRGDLLETTDHPSSTLLTVKRTFFVQITSDGALLSLDGSTFRPIGDQLTGRVEIGLSGPDVGQPITGINLALEAFLKK